MPPAMPSRQQPEPERFTFPVEIKSSDVPGSSGRVQGFANVFEVDGSDFVDSGMDVVQRGAFTKTIERRVNKGMVPFLDSHNWQSSSVLGTVIKADERAGTIQGQEVFGLWFEAEMSSAPDAQAIRTKMIEGHLPMISVGMRVLQESPERVQLNGDVEATIRKIKEVALLEISSVPLAENEYSQLVTAKSLTAVPFAALRIVDDPKWTPALARDAVSERWEADTAKRRQAFLAHDRGEDRFRYIIGSVSNRELVASKQGICRAALMIHLDKAHSFQANLNPYLKELDLVAPWDGGAVTVEADGSVSLTRSGQAPTSSDGAAGNVTSFTRQAKVRDRELELRLRGI